MVPTYLHISIIFFSTFIGFGLNCIFFLLNSKKYLSHVYIEMQHETFPLHCFQKKKILQTISFLQIRTRIQTKILSSPTQPNPTPIVVKKLNENWILFFEIQTKECTHMFFILMVVAKAIRGRVGAGAVLYDPLGNELWHDCGFCRSHCHQQEMWPSTRV
jgi:hypothetical protein